MKNNCWKRISAGLLGLQIVNGVSYYSSGANMFMDMTIKAEAFDGLDNSVIDGITLDLENGEEDNTEEGFDLIINSTDALKCDVASVNPPDSILLNQMSQNKYYANGVTFFYPSEDGNGTVYVLFYITNETENEGDSSTIKANIYLYGTGKITISELPLTYSLVGREGELTPATDKSLSVTVAAGSEILVSGTPNPVIYDEESSGSGLDTTPDVDYSLLEYGRNYRSLTSPMWEEYTYTPSESGYYRFSLESSDESAFDLNAYSGDVVYENKEDVTAHQFDCYLTNGIPVCLSLKTRDTSLVGVNLNIDRLNSVIVAEGIEGGTVTSEKSLAVKDEEVNLTIAPDSGYAVKSVKIDDTEIEPVEGVYYFTMPADNVTVTAEFEAIDYNINKIAEHGTIIAKVGATSATAAHYGDMVTLDVASDTGYFLKSLTVTDADENDITVTNNQFTMPANAVTVTAEFDKYISGASLTLGDDLGLNFYINGITDENADQYTVKFEGDCLEDESALTQNESTGQYYATTHVYAKDLDKKITASLYKGDELLGSTEYSVLEYLEEAPETVTDEKALALIKATKVFGAMSADYFYEGEHGFSAAYSEYLTQSNLTDEQVINHAKNNYATEFTTDDAKISLVLDEKTAIRLYVKGVQPDGENLKPSKQANKDVYPSYYEIAGLTPDKLATEQSVTIGGVDYKFTALSWANRIFNQENPSEKNVNMAKAVTAYYLAAHYYYLQNHPVDLSALTENYEAMDGEVLTGTLGAKIKISIADDATIILRDVTINGEHDDEDYQWAGITCDGNAKLILEGKNNVKGFYKYYPGVYIAPEKTLTIDGTGTLNVNSNGYGAGIGGGDDISSGNIVIDGGVINASGGGEAAGIGGAHKSKCGNITINSGTITATGGYMAAGIGSGNYGSCTYITINGGTVTAIGGNGAAGIGSGHFGKCSDITISDIVTKVIATKGSESPNSIGAGYGGTCGTVTIAEGANVEQN